MVGTNYTGVLTSVLTYPTGTRTFHCVIAAGIVVGPCTHVGTLPLLTGFTQNCLASGVGDWACLIEHD